MTTVPLGQPSPGAEHCNTFAVPVVVNAFGRHEHVEWRAQSPLVPWKISGAESLWVPIDSSQQLFDRFVDEGPQPKAIIDTNARAGHLVVVSGEKKVGKTTLLHKCVHSLTQRLHAVITGEEEGNRPAPPRWSVLDHASPHVLVVPLAGPENKNSAIAWANGRPEEVEVVNRRILDDISEAVGGQLAEEAGEQLRSKDVYRSFGALSDALLSLEYTLLVVVPDFEWRDESVTRTFYRSCSDNARTGIVFFVESSSRTTGGDLSAEFGDLQDSPVTHLEVGGLTRENWRHFIRARHTAHDIPGPHLTVADEVLSAPPERWMQLNIGKLQSALHSIAQKAHGEQETEIDMDRVRLYTEGLDGPDPDDFRRSP